MEMDNSAKKFWDKHASRYDASEKQFEPVSQDILEKTKKYLGPHDRVLDFGCATGTEIGNDFRHTDPTKISNVCQSVLIRVQKIRPFRVQKISTLLLLTNPNLSYLALSILSGPNSSLTAFRAMLVSVVL